MFCSLKRADRLAEGGWWKGVVWRKGRVGKERKDRGGGRGGRIERLNNHVCFTRPGVFSRDSRVEPSGSNNIKVFASTNCPKFPEREVHVSRAMIKGYSLL